MDRHHWPHDPRGARNEPDGWVVIGDEPAGPPPAGYGPVADSSYEPPYQPPPQPYQRPYSQEYPQPPYETPAYPQPQPPYDPYAQAPETGEYRGRHSREPYPDPPAPAYPPPRPASAIPGPPPIPPRPASAIPGPAMPPRPASAIPGPPPVPYPRRPGGFDDFGREPPMPAFRDEPEYRDEPPDRWEEEPPEVEPSSPWLTVLAWTACFFLVPVLIYLAWALTRSGVASPGCVNAAGEPCMSPRADAITRLVAIAPALAGAFTMAVVVSVGLRWLTAAWRASTVGFAAAVIGAGVATLAASILR